MLHNTSYMVNIGCHRGDAAAAAPLSRVTFCNILRYARYTVINRIIRARSARYARAAARCTPRARRLLLLMIDITALRHAAYMLDYAPCRADALPCHTV